MERARSRGAQPRRVRSRGPHARSTRAVEFVSKANSRGPQPGGPAINPATGQPDYSAQWAEYYRSLGMSKEAEMIEGQMVNISANI